MKELAILLGVRPVTPTPLGCRDCDDTGASTVTKCYDVEITVCEVDYGLPHCGSLHLFHLDY